MLICPNKVCHHVGLDVFKHTSNVSNMSAWESNEFGFIIVTYGNNNLFFWRFFNCYIDLEPNLSRIINSPMDVFNFLGQ